MPMNVDRERAILRDYEALLADAEREIEDLREIVERVRRRLARFSEAPNSPRSEVSSVPPQSSDDSARALRRQYAGRKSLPAFLVELMNDRERRTLDQVEEAVTTAPEFADRVPARNTINTRMNELAKKPGTFEKLPDGSYQKRDGTSPRGVLGIAPGENIYDGVDANRRLDENQRLDETPTNDPERPNEPERPGAPTRPAP
jgi:hypothetical protein